MKEVNHYDSVKAYLATIIESSNDAIISKNLDGIITSWNKAAEQLFGYSADEAIGQHMNFLIPPEYANEEKDILAKLRQGKKIDHFETTRKTKDGRRVNLSITVSPIADDTGRIIGASKIARDITRRKRNEARQLLLVEAGRILGSSLDYELTLSAVCKLVVPKFADWCSLDLFFEEKQLQRIEVVHKDPEKVKLAKEFRRRYPPQDNKNGGLMEVLRTGQPLLYSNITDQLLIESAKDKEHLNMMRALGLHSVIIAPLIARGNILGAITLVSAESGYSYDQTDLGLAQELAAQSALAVDNARLFHESQLLAAKQKEALQKHHIMQQQLSLLVEASGNLNASPDLPSVLEAILNLSIRMVSADAYAIWKFDFSFEQWSIGQASNLSEHYQQNAIKVLASTPTMLDKPIIAEDVLAFEMLHERKELYKNEGIKSLMALPLKVRGVCGGTLVFYYHTVHPFSEVEISVATAIANLASSAISTAELYEELKNNDRKKDEFLAILAHELRNPLAPISNALQLLKSPKLNDVIRNEAISLVNNQIYQMTHLLEDLLDISRITRGKIELRLMPCDVSEAIKIAVESTMPLMHEYKHQLNINMASEPCRINGDITRLVQVFTNLLNNAAKYTDKEGRIFISTSCEGNFIVVKIKDNGIGIPSHMLHSIFDMFEQVDSSMERSYGGLGIGLTLVKNIVEMHHGRIEAISEGIGKGSEFIVRLPKIESVNMSQETALPLVDCSTTRCLKVLVVDDNDASAKTMGWALEMLGHEIQLAHDGPAALQAALTFIPDVVLLDIGLPGMNGYEVCRTLRQESMLSHTIFIAQTGWGQKEHREHSKEAGFSHHLVKPINIDVLEKLLEQEMSKFPGK